MYGGKRPAGRSIKGEAEQARRESRRPSSLQKKARDSRREEEAVSLRSRALFFARRSLTIARS